MGSQLSWNSYAVQVSEDISPAASITYSGLSCDGPGVEILLDITQITSGQGITLSVYGVDAFGNTYEKLLATQVTATGQYVYQICPGATAAGTAGTTTFASLSAGMPKQFQIQLAFEDTSGTKSVTFSVSYQVIK